ncbi:MAG: hypothetical protein HC888_18885 [Candidatus Competibacteraceae bacterium]|nr:hypothetical protein [Candidatus Competibacteraceae bacterium]
MVYRNLSAIFGINAYQLFEQSFAKLSFIRQIWIKVTGRYESYREQFIGQAEGPGPRARRDVVPSIVAPVEVAVSADKVMKAGAKSPRSAPGMIVTGTEAASARRRPIGNRRPRCERRTLARSRSRPGSSSAAPYEEIKKGETTLSLPLFRPRVIPGFPPFSARKPGSL